MKLRELEKRLKLEPDNLGLRVTVAGLMGEAGRSVEAAELYRSVALAYRDQGRTQQAIAVCRSILEIAPDDSACHALLASLQGPPPWPGPNPPPMAAFRGPGPPSPADEPARRSSIDMTPLPRPMPHHVFDPTGQNARVSDRELLLPLAPPEDTLVPSSAAPTSTLDIDAELDTRQLPRITTDQLAKLDEATNPIIGRDTPMHDDNDDPLADLMLPRDTPIMPQAPHRDSPAVRLSSVIPRDSEEILTAPLVALPRNDDDELTIPRDRLPPADDE